MAVRVWDVVVEDDLAMESVKWRNEASIETSIEAWHKWVVVPHCII